MSRLGNKPINIPAGVTIDIAADNQVTVKGPKGTLSLQVDPILVLRQQEKELFVALAKDTGAKSDGMTQGLWRALVQNMVIGVSGGYKKTLQLIGVGYRANMQGDVLELVLGYSHNTFLKVPKELTVTVETTKGKQAQIYIHVQGIDKGLVGQFASKIREQKPPEPYVSKRSNTPKGIRYVDELVIGKLKKSGK
ncbi:MAG: 50S ribosomal protein L6 [Cytophagales bacterium]